MADSLICQPGRSYEHGKTLGSLFAGIGGFDLGFEQAGWQTAWQVELNPTNRAVLADRFPGAARHPDVRHVGGHNLASVDCITAGFPCQDISTAGSRSERRGLRGERSGLFYEVLRILDEIRPRWVVLENVAALLHSNACRDLETVIAQLAQRGYLGSFRVLNAQYFGVPQQRRRIFLVAGLGRGPSPEFLADAAPVEAIPPSAASLPESFPADGWAANTYTAKKANCQISIGSEVLVAEAHGWDQMVERARSAEVHGLCLGLDAANLAQTFAAGNAVCPPVARWIAEILNRS